METRARSTWLTVLIWSTKRKKLLSMQSWSNFVTRPTSSTLLLPKLLLFLSTWVRRALRVNHKEQWISMLPLKEYRIWLDLENLKKIKVPFEGKTNQQWYHAVIMAGGLNFKLFILYLLNIAYYHRVCLVSLLLYNSIVDFVGFFPC